MKATYLTCCVAIPEGDVQALHDMIDGADQISRRTFLASVDRASLAETERALGYESHPSRGLTMAGDWHVWYWRSFYRGEPCVGFTWSAIEHIFTETSQFGLTSE